MKILQVSLLLVAIALGFFAPDLIKSFRENQAKIDINQYCMLSTTACVQNDVTMTLEHDLAKPLLPSLLEVTWENANSETLLLSLQGLEMEMGVAKYQLHKQPNGRFSTTVMLPVCTQDKMTWIGTLSNGQEEVYPAIRMER